MRRLAAVLLLCACATVPTVRRELEQGAKELKPPPDAANLYVYRTGAPLGIVGAAVEVDIYVDESYVGTLAPKTFLVLTIRPGEHKLMASSKGGSEDRTFVAGAGRSHYFEASLGGMSLAGPGGRIDAVADERDAVNDLRGCRLIASVAAESLRKIAAQIAKVHVDRVLEPPLLAEAARAVEAMAGPPDPALQNDLDRVVARVRATRPGVKDRDMIDAGAAAMVLFAHAPAARAKMSPARVPDAATGLVLRRDGAQVVVAGILPDSPAAGAGLTSGLELCEVDGRATRDQAPIHVLALLVGPPGSEVALTIGRPGDPDRKVVLRRAASQPGIVECRLLGGAVLYLRPWDLTTATARRIRDHGRAAGAAASRVVLDLRDSDGGAPDTARDLADSFMDRGPIFSLEGLRIPDVDARYNATPSDSPLERARLAVLVNGHTSGPSEAVAAALQDNHRATVLGSRTAGIATVDYAYRVGGTWVPIPAARIFRANRHPLEGVGVSPDAVAMPAAREDVSDAPCAGVTSAEPVVGDPLIRQAVGLLQGAP